MSARTTSGRPRAWGSARDCGLHAPRACDEAHDGGGGDAGPGERLASHRYGEVPSRGHRSSGMVRRVSSAQLGWTEVVVGRNDISVRRVSQAPSHNDRQPARPAHRTPTSPLAWRELRDRKKGTLLPIAQAQRTRGVTRSWRKERQWTRHTHAAGLLPRRRATNGEEARRRVSGE